MPIKNWIELNQYWCFLCKLWHWYFFPKLTSSWPGHWTSLPVREWGRGQRRPDRQQVVPSGIQWQRQHRRPAMGKSQTSVILMCKIKLVSTSCFKSPKWKLLNLWLQDMMSKIEDPPPPKKKSDPTAPLYIYLYIYIYIPWLIQFETIFSEISD